MQVRRYTGCRTGRSLRSMGEAVKCRLTGTVAVLLALCLLPSARSARVIPVDDIDRWRVAVYAGNRGGMFVEGPRLGCGVPGRMVFDGKGTAFVLCGTFVYRISKGLVELVAGVPGIGGVGDGDARGAVLTTGVGMAMGRNGHLLIIDRLRYCVRELFEQDGRWYIRTFAGVPGKKGRKDGAAGTALFSKLNSIAVDDDGSVYVMDGDFLRRIADGKVVTLNPAGGTGYFEGDLQRARFRRIMGCGAMSFVRPRCLILADKWNNVFRLVDLARGVTRTVAGGPARGTPGFRRTGAVDGDAMKEARFVSGGGPDTAIYDPVSGNVYTKTADENAVRVITPGFKEVRTLGPLRRGRPRKLEGALKDIRGDAALLGVDGKGRVFVSLVPGVISVFYRDDVPPPKGVYPAEEAVVKVKVPLDVKRLDTLPRGVVPPQGAEPLCVGGERLVENGRFCGLPAVAWGNGKFVVAFRDGRREGGILVLFLDASGRFVAGWSLKADGWFLGDPAVASFGKGYILACSAARRGCLGQVMLMLLDENGMKRGPVSVGGGIRPAVAVSPEGVVMVSWLSLVPVSALGPFWEVRCRFFDRLLASRGSSLKVSGRAVAHDCCAASGRFYLVYSVGRKVRAIVLSRDGRVVKDGIKMGGWFERFPRCVAGGGTVAVTAAFQPHPNPWGWHGPGAVVIGRLNPDGSTPDRVSADYDAIANGGLKGLVDHATWRNRKGWPAGIPGGFKGTDNGYWPYMYSCPAWVGGRWLVVWVRARLRERYFIGAHDVFATLVDASSMKPLLAPLTVAAGGEGVTRTAPVVASDGNSLALVAYRVARRDGSVVVGLRLLRVKR